MRRLAAAAAEGREGERATERLRKQQRCHVRFSGSDELYYDGCRVVIWETLVKEGFAVKRVLGLFCIAGILAICVGCVCEAMVVPIEGPMAAPDNPHKQLTATFTWAGTGHGTVKINLPSGEVCKGKYTTVPDGAVGVGFGSLLGQPGYASHIGTAMSIRNKQYGQALLVGDQGTTVQVEYVTSASNPTHGYGLAKDSHGNVYKIVY